MQTALPDALKNFSGSNRPLRNLNKAQLFIYPEANPGHEPEFKYLKEVIFRRHAYQAELGKVGRVEDDLRQARIYLMQATGTDSREYGQRRIKRQEEELIRAKASLQHLGDAQNAISHEEVVENYRRTHKRMLEETIARFRDGSLFKCREWGWTRFITAEGDDIDADRAAYRLAETHAMLCEEDETQAFWEIREFFRIRIQPSKYWRKKFLDEDGEMAGLKDMKKEAVKDYWQAWIRYNTTTVKYGWADESGMAYDERSFETYKRFKMED